MTKSKILHTLPYVLLAMLLIGFLCTHSPNLEYDIDPSYILFGAARPPIYPLFIWLFRWAGSYQFIFIMWAQGILLFSALLYARFWLRKNLNIAEFPIFLVCLVVLLTISFHFQIWCIQSEGLSFPFFIFTFFALIECFRKFDTKKLIVLALWASLLVLTRLQFIYLYVIFGILIVWYSWQKVSAKSILAAIAILFGSMTMTTVADHSYHYYKHGFFGTAPYSGLMVLIQALYLTDDHAADYFTDPAEKKFVQTMIGLRNAQHLNEDAELLASLKPSYFQYAYEAYSKNYLSLQKIIEETLHTSVEITEGKSTNYAADITATHIAKTLIKHDPIKNSLFLIWKFVECMGGVPLLLFFLILSIGIPFKILRDNIREPNAAIVFVGMISIITIFNALIIAACNPDLSAYFCYSQFMLYCLAAFLVSRTLKRI